MPRSFLEPLALSASGAAAYTDRMKNSVFVLMSLVVAVAARAQEAAFSAEIPAELRQSLDSVQAADLVTDAVLDQAETLATKVLNDFDVRGTPLLQEVRAGLVAVRATTDLDLCVERDAMTAGALNRLKEFSTGTDDQRAYELVPYVYSDLFQSRGCLRRTEEALFIPTYLKLIDLHGRRELYWNVSNSLELARSGRRNFDLQPFIDAENTARVVGYSLPAGMMDKLYWAYVRKSAATLLTHTWGDFYFRSTLGGVTFSYGFDQQYGRGRYEAIRMAAIVGLDLRRAVARLDACYGEHERGNRVSCGFDSSDIRHIKDAAVLGGEDLKRMIGGAY